MARRISWTNNSTSYDGTNIYRAVTIDPQSLPAPLATVGPVAQGAVAEYIDLTGSGDQCYAVRDFDSGGDGALSDVVCFDDPLDGAQPGDFVEGGYYAGTITYADSRQFHLIVADISQDTTPGQWGFSGNLIGADDFDDGKANTQVAADLGGSPVFDLATNYTDTEGNNDYYIAADNEWAQIDSTLDPTTTAATEFQTGGSQAFDDSNQYWTSRETSGTQAAVWFFDQNAIGGRNKTATTFRARPIRRVPV